MTKKRLSVWAAAAIAAIAVVSPASAQQASLTLRNCGTAICYHNNTAWTLGKQGVFTPTGVGVGSVTWTVTATRGLTSDNIIEVKGVITIENTGSAPATIGNIVVNLQKRAIFGNPTWVSAAADMADASVGNAATKANIAKAASQEDPAANAAVGANNYTTPGGGAGLFIKTAGSGLVEFTDVSDNTIYSLIPQKVIPVGGSVTLKYTATFNNTILGLAAGAQIRSETIVSFGNAGGRGDSGASSPNIDINGSGSIDADEAHVRSVPCRDSKDLPPLDRCNNVVTLSDTDPDSLTTTPSNSTVTVSGFTTDIGGGSGIEVISNSVVRSVSVNVAGGTNGGSLCNTALLQGESGSVFVGTNSFPCCIGVNLSALSCVEIPPQGPPPPPPPQLEGCTYTQGGWGAEPNGGNVGALLYANFSAVYPGGVVEIGIPGTNGKSIKFLTKTTVVNGTAQNPGQIPAGAFNIVDTGLSNPKFTYQIGVTNTALQAITAFLPAGGTPGALDNDLENPTSTSAGVFAGQVLALQLNVAFGAAGVITNVGSHTICHTGTPADGQTIAQVLAAANIALGGGALPYGMTSISQLSDLVTKLNEAFDNCTATDWAKSYICP